MDIVQEIETLLGRQAVDNLDFEALEMAARKQVLQLAAKAIEQRLNADASDAAGSHLPCRCGAEAQLIGGRTKTFPSVLGALRLERAYYYCAACGHGYFPRDRHLGMEDTSLSPAVTRMTGTVGAMVSFAEGRELLQQLAGVTINAKQVERTAEARAGNRRRRAPAQRTSRHSSITPDALSRSRWNRHPHAGRGTDRSVW